MSGDASGIRLKCPRCNYSWIYKGSHKIKASCPDCRYLVEIEFFTVDDKGVYLTERINE